MAGTSSTAVETAPTLFADAASPFPPTNHPEQGPDPTAAVAGSEVDQAPPALEHQARAILLDLNTTINIPGPRVASDQVPAAAISESEQSASTTLPGIKCADEHPSTTTSGGSVVMPEAPGHARALSIASSSGSVSVSAGQTDPAPLPQPAAPGSTRESPPSASSLHETNGVDGEPADGPSDDWLDAIRSASHAAAEPGPAQHSISSNSTNGGAPPASAPSPASPSLRLDPSRGFQFRFDVSGDGNTETPRAALPGAGQKQRPGSLQPRSQTRLQLSLRLEHLRLTDHDMGEVADWAQAQAGRADIVKLWLFDNSISDEGAFHVGRMLHEGMQEVSFSPVRHPSVPPPPPPPPLIKESWCVPYLCWPRVPGYWCAGSRSDLPLLARLQE